MNHSKVIPLGDLAERCGALRSDGRSIVLCHGVFDMVHPGHIKHLEAAAEEGDALVVSITADSYVSKGPGRPVFNQRLRADALAALAIVDYVAIVEHSTALPAIEAVKPKVYAKGTDYAHAESDLTGQIVEEQAAVEHCGGRVIFTDEETYSSTELLNRHFQVLPPAVERYLNCFRTTFPLERVFEHLDEMASTRVLVIGDSIIDEYVYCDALGKSAKEHLVSTRYLGEERFAGGTHAVANHLAGFCREVALATVVGEDEGGDFLANRLCPSVQQHVLYSGSKRTTVKRRFVDRAFMQKLFQICEIDDQNMEPDEEACFQEMLGEVIGDYDLVVVADFGHGLLSPSTRERVTQDARYLALNVQTNSANIGFNLVTDYPGAQYVSIDEPEARLATRERSTEVSLVAQQILQRMSSELVSVTRGHSGTLVVAGDRSPEEIPAFSSEVVDRLGAGDAYLAVTAPAAAARLDPALVGFIGNAVGALAVRIVGNRDSVEPVALKKFITTLLR